MRRRMIREEEGEEAGEEEDDVETQKGKIYSLQTLTPKTFYLTDYHNI